jgi:hypothetical protein
VTRKARAEALLSQHVAALEEAYASMEQKVDRLGGADGGGQGGRGGGGPSANPVARAEQAVLNARERRDLQVFCLIAQAFWY